jgi:hypothetical protein
MLRLFAVPSLALAINLVTSPQLSAGDKSALFEGTVSATLARGETTATQFLFTRKGNQLRVENVDKTKPEPINIVDLEAKKLTIIYPHNSTFVHVDLIPPLPDRAHPGAPALPPGFPTPPNMNASPNPVGEAVGFPGTTPSSPTVTAAHPAPAISPPPGFPKPPPPMPEMPQMPSMPQKQMQNPTGAPPTGAGGPPALPGPMMPPPRGYGAPGMPPMPAMMPGGAPELKKTDKTRKIQGFDCTLYTISDRMETFEIWATSDSALFPFRLLERNYHNRHFGPRMLEEEWVELLQKKSLFPLEATLRMEHGSQERLSFKVEKLEKKKIDPATAGFQPPENYYEIQPPPF